MIALLTACLFFFSILVRALNCISKARAKTVFGHLKTTSVSQLQCHIALSAMIFPWEKITKREQRVIEILINNTLVKERVSYHLNKLFVSNKTGDIIF